MTRRLNQLQPWAVFLLRIALGASMLYHGWPKVVPASLHGSLIAPMDNFARFVVSLGMPHWLGYVSALTEFVGGIFLLLGFLTRFSAFMVAGNMLVALITVNLHHGYAGSEYTLALIAIALTLVTTGSGALALDRRFGLS